MKRLLLFLFTGAFLVAAPWVAAGPLSPQGATITGVCPGSGVLIRAGSNGSGSATCVYSGNFNASAKLGSGTAFDGSGAIIVAAGSGVQLGADGLLHGPLVATPITGTGSGGAPIACPSCIVTASLAGTVTHLQKSTGAGTLGDATPTESGGVLSIGEVLAIDRALAISGVIAPAALTGTRKDNYTPVDATSGWGLGSASVWDASVNTADTTVTGIVTSGLPTGAFIFIRNTSASTKNLILSNADSNSSTANQFALTAGTSWTVWPTEVLILRWTGVSLRQYGYMGTHPPVLSVAGLLTVGSITGLPAEACGAGSALTSMSTTGVGVCRAIVPTGGLTGSGTTNRIAKYTGAFTQGNANATDDGTTYTVSEAAHVTGAGTFDSTWSGSNTSSASLLGGSAASSTVATVRPNQANNSGLCVDAGSDVSLCANGIEGIRVLSSGILTVLHTISGPNAASWKLNTAGTSATVPSVSPSGADTASGLGQGTSGHVNLIASSVNAVDVSSTTLTNHVGIVIGNTCVVAAGSGTLDDNNPTCASGTAAASAVIEYTTNGVTNLDGLSIGQTTGTLVYVGQATGSTNAISAINAASGSLSANRFALDTGVTWIIGTTPASNAAKVPFLYNGASFTTATPRRLPSLLTDGSVTVGTTLSVGGVASFSGVATLGASARLRDTHSSLTLSAGCGTGASASTGETIFSITTNAASLGTCSATISMTSATPSCACWDTAATPATTPSVTCNATTLTLGPTGLIGGHTYTCLVGDH